jgi:hypothetical protein
MADAGALRGPGIETQAVSGPVRARRVLIGAVALGGAVLTRPALDALLGAGGVTPDSDLLLPTLATAVVSAVVARSSMRARVPAMTVLLLSMVGGIANIGLSALLVGLAHGLGISVVGIAIFATFVLSWLGAFLGFLFGLAFMPLVHFGSSVEARPSVDAEQHVMLGSAVWLTLIGAGVAILAPHADSAAGAIVAAAGGAGLSALLALRDLRLLRWLRRVRAGDVPLWAIVPRGQVEATLWLPPLLRCADGREPDQVLVLRGQPLGEGPFRDVEQLSPIATVHGHPDDPLPWARLRPVIGVGLALVQLATVYLVVTRGS